MYEFPKSRSSRWETVPKSKFTVHPDYKYPRKDIALIKLADSHDIGTFPCLAGDDRETFVGYKATGITFFYFFCIKVNI